MRIVAGTHRGRPLKAPEGSDTRPTIDRVREALFSSLYSLRGGFEGATVLDAYAGSGALGFEALSRGADSAVFCERDRRAAKVVRDNASSLGFGNDRVKVIEIDSLAPSQARFGSAAFDLVFLDPPYAYDSTDVLGAVRALCGTSISEDAIIVYEHAIKSADDIARASEANGFEVASQKKYGKTGVTILRPSTERSQA